MNVQPRSSLRAVAIVVAVAAPILGLMVLAVTNYRSTAQRALQEQGIRVLSAMASGLPERLQDIEAATKRAAQVCKFECRPGAATSLPDGVEVLGPESSDACHEKPSLETEGNGLYLHFRAPPLCVRTAIGTTLDTLSAAQGFSGDLLLVGPNGEVLYQRLTAFPVADLADLPPADPPKAAADDDKKDSPTRPGVAGSPTEVSYAGARHHLLLVPVRLTYHSTPANAPEPGPEILYLCTLLPVPSLGTLFAVPPVSVVALLFLLVLAVLAWPVLKLWHIGPRERLQASDVRLLVLASVLVAGVAVFLLEDVRTYLRLTIAFDDEMRQLARSVERRLRHELDDMYQVVRSVAHGNVPSTLKFHAFADVNRIGADGKPLQRYSSKPSLENGRLRWTLEEQRTTDVNLADRGYFRDLRAQRYWGFQLPRQDKAMGFTVEAVHSRRTAEFAVIVATPIRGRAGSAGRDLVIGSTPMRPLVDTVLSPGMSFAVVDTAGKVQLHTNSNKNLRENLLDECRRDRELVAALAARRAEYLAVSCYGGNQRAYVAPLRGTPWSIVVLRDKRPLQVLNAEIGIAWLVLFGFHFLGLLALLLAMQAVRDGYQAAWLWPRRACARRYVAVAARLGVTAAVALWAAGRHEGLGIALELAAVSSVGVALLCLTLDDGEVLHTAERTVATTVALVAGFVLLGAAGWAGDWPLVVAWLATFTFWTTLLLPRRHPDALPVALNAASVGMLLLMVLAPDATAPALLIAGGSLGVSRAGRRWWRPGETGFRAAYAAMLVGLLAILAVVPALALFRDAAQYATTAFVKHGQLDLTRALVTRARDIRARRAMPGSGTPRTVADAVAREEIDQRRNVYDGSYLRWRPRALAANGQPRPPYCQVPAEHCDGRGGAPNLLTYWVLPLLPAWADLAADLRRAACNGASDGAWCWQHLPEDGYMKLFLRDPSLRAALGAEDPFENQPPVDGPRPLGALPRALFAAAWLVATLVGFGLVWAIVRRLFVLDADPSGAVEASSGLGRAARRIAVFTPAGDAELLGPVAEGPDVAVLDLRQTCDGSDLDTWGKREDVRTKPIVELDHLEAVLDDPARSDAVLRFVQGLVRDGRRLVLTSEVDPTHYLADVEPSPAHPDDSGEAGTGEKKKTPPAPASAATHLARWSQLLSGFAHRSLAVGGADDALTSRYASGACDPAVPDEVNDTHLEARNESVWRSCTRREQLALRQLADEGFLNPADPDLVRRLLHRRLVRRDPSFVLLDASFRRFVRRAVSDVETTAWESTGDPSGWARLRTPLLGVILLAALFFFVTQREVFNSALGMVTALGAALPVLLRMFSLLGNDTRGAGAAS